MQVYVYTQSKVCLFIGTVRSLRPIEETVTPIRPRQEDLNLQSSVFVRLRMDVGGEGGSGGVVSKMN